MVQDELRAELRMRRARTLEGIKGGVLLLPSAPTALRNNDVEHEYRQSSDFVYLSGFEEPDSFLVLSDREEGYVLFARERDPERETWDGRRAGTEGARQQYDADQAFPITELEARLVDLLVDVERVYFALGEDRLMDELLLRVISRVRAKARRGGTWPTEIVDPRTVLHELRLIKSPYELKCMRRAAEVSGWAHVEAMRRCRPGMNELEIEGILLSEFRRGGCRRHAYPSIVGAGENATILHYRENDQKMVSGALLLIDAGGEFEHYASDITRTFPVNGRFSPAQRELYEVVLESQLTAIAAARSGATMDDVHGAAVRVLTRGLVELGFLEGELERLVAEEAFKPWYMHRTSHYLGMDVHDVGRYYDGRAPRTFEPDMVITVEPGLYISKDDETAPERFRGLGIRIEDDVRITEGAPEVLTSGVPKTVEEIERVCLGLD